MEFPSGPDELSRVCSPIQAQEPRICTQWALQGQCSHNARCKHSHAYRLTAAQEAALRAKIKTVACVSVKEAGLEPCPNGEDCLYGQLPGMAGCLTDSSVY